MLRAVEDSSKLLFFPIELSKGPALFKLLPRVAEKPFSSGYFQVGSRLLLNGILLSESSLFPAER